MATNPINTTAPKNRIVRFSLQQLTLLPLCLALAGCMTAAQHQKQLGQTDDRALTLGTVQKQVKVGTSQAEVAAALGSPNIVTGDSGDREVWIYDKVASESSYSSDGGGVSGTATGTGYFPGARTFDANGSVSGNINGSYSKSSGASSFTQRTLTVVIKFTAGKTVESVSYNSTRF